MQRFLQIAGKLSENSKKCLNQRKLHETFPGLHSFANVVYSGGMLQHVSKNQNMPKISAKIMTEYQCKRGNEVFCKNPSSKVSTVF